MHAIPPRQEILPCVLLAALNYLKPSKLTAKNNIVAYLVSFLSTLRKVKISQFK